MMTVHCWSNAQFGSIILCCFLRIYCSQIDAFWISTDRSFWYHHHRYKVPTHVIITTSRAQQGLYSSSQNSSSMRSRYAIGNHPLKSAEASESFGEMEKSQDAEEFDWIVYVDQSKASLERGGVATLDAFMGIAPTNSVSVMAAILPKPPKGKGPYVRCVPLKRQTKFSAFEVSNVNSVEKVYRILTKHMGLSGITVQMCDCLKLKYKGTGYLEAKKVPLAIEAYNRALELGVPSQDGVILFMRAAAHAALAVTQRGVLLDMLSELKSMVPPKSSLRVLYDLAAHESSFTHAIFRKIRHDTQKQEEQWGRIQFWHGLYQHSMLKALEDALKATQLLPTYAPAWERAGSILSDLWRLEASLECYEKAKQLDPSLDFEPAFDCIRMRQQLVADATLLGWADEPLRLALDAKG